MDKKLKIISVSSEVAPYAKVGGLANVAKSLPLALKKLGHQIIIVTPLYKSVNKKLYNLKKVIEDIKIEIDDNNIKTASFWLAQLDNKIPIYFIDHGQLFSDHLRIYGAKNDNQRFYFFNCAVLALINQLEIYPDIIQCHDWQTGLIPQLLKTKYKNIEFLKETACLFTIHNLSFQLGHNWWEVPINKKDYANTPLPDFKNPDWEYINFAKRAIKYADLINTVSEKYAEEILKPAFGQDLQRMLANRQDKLFGIINGIDETDYNPATDPGLVENYNVNNLELKLKNKAALQKIFNLPVKEKIPLLAIVARLTEQKGLDLLFQIIEVLARHDLQLIIWGEGDKQYEKIIQKFCRKYPKKFAANLELDTKHVTKVFAGADILLVPSRFEPCGLTQLESLRYGTIPVVHEVGGLSDTITDYNPRTESGNGFVFKKYNHYDFLVTIIRAITNYKHEEKWQRLVKKGMQQSFSWEIPAKKYVKLFRKAIYNKNK